MYFAPCGKKYPMCILEKWSGCPQSVLRESFSKMNPVFSMFSSAVYMCVQLVKVALVYHRDRKALYKWSSFPIVVHNCVVVTTFTVQVKDPQFKTQRRHKSGLRGVMSWCTLSAGHTSPRRADSGRTSSVKLCQIKHADPSTVPTPWEIKEVGCTPNF